MDKVYTKYKDTGIDWLGKIPEHWEMKKLKWAMKFSYGETLNSEDRVEGDIPVYGSNGITGYHNLSITSAPCIIIGRKGSFGEVNFSKIKCFPIDTTYYVDETLTKNHLRFLFYFLKSMNLSAYSNDTGVPGLSREDTYTRIVVLPKYSEQEQISNFLDKKTSEIDTLISNKEKLIELLKEERTATINNAVTKGINPKVKMKDSGVEWLGKIPEHWEVKKLKFIAEIKFSNVDKKSYDNENIVLLCNYVDVYKNEYITEEIKFMKATATNEEINKFKVKVGDILVTKDSETPDDIANPALVVAEIENLVCGYHLCQISVQKDFLWSDFLFRIFQSKLFNSNFEKSANGVTRYGLSVDSFKNVYIPIPSLKEQNVIFNFISQKMNIIHDTIKKIEKEIELIKEYRTALISEAVTGKIDLRNE